MRRAVAALTVAIALVQMSGAATAQDAEDKELQAQYHFKRGQVFFESEEYGSAIAEFDQAYILTSNYQYLPRIAKTHEALLNYKRAIEAYEAYLRKGDKKLTPAERKQTAEELARLKAAMKSSANAELALNHFREGQNYYNQGKFGLASVEFEQSYQLTHDPAYLYNLGTAHAGGGDTDLAVEAYKQFLDESGDKVNAANRAAIEQEIARLEASRKQVQANTDAREHYAKGRTLFGDGAFETARQEYKAAYDLTGNVDYLYFIGLTDDQRGNASGAIEAYTAFLNGGGGSMDARKRVEVQESIRRLGGGVEAPPVAEEATSPPQPREEPVMAEGVAPGMPTAAPVASAPAPKGRVWAWVGFGVGGAAAVGAVITGVLALKKEKDVRAQCDGIACPASVADDIDTIKTLGPLTDALIGVAAAGVVTGVVALIVGKRGESSNAVALAPTPGGGGAIAMSGSF